MPSKTHQQLISALLHGVQGHRSEIWGVDKSDVSRRINGERGIQLEDMAKALDVLGIRLVLPEQDRARLSKFPANPR